MSLNFNGTSATSINFNGDEVKIVMINGEYAWAKPYTLTYSCGTGGSVYYTRTSTIEPTATAGERISSGGKIYYNDTITPTISLWSNYYMTYNTSAVTVSSDLSYSYTPTELTGVLISATFAKYSTTLYKLTSMYRSTNHVVINVVAKIYKAGGTLVTTKTFTLGQSGAVSYITYIPAVETQYGYHINCTSTYSTAKATTGLYGGDYYLDTTTA